jgi:hypothetical protein
MTFLTVVGGPVANLGLASGALSLFMLIMKVDLVVMGTAIFGLYTLGLSAIYLIMKPALRLSELMKAFQAAIVMVGVAFLAFLLTYLS